jgi:signal transduction histidine kinase
LETQPSIIPLFLIGTVLLSLFSSFLVIFLVVQKRKQYKHLLEKERLGNAYKNQLLQTELEVQEQAFKYMSEEIHDNILQGMGSIKFQLHSILYDIKDEELKHKLTDSNELLGKAINNLRNLSHSLNNSYVANVGLIEAVEKETGYINATKQIKCFFLREGQDYSLGVEKELLIFRIIQEGISNALKHGKPQSIEIVLNYQPEKLSINIKDDGTGFDTSRKNSDGIGLNNMNLRAVMLKGNLDITSVKDIGTTIHLEVANNKTQSI